MKMPWESAIEGITSLISEAITDGDLRAKLQVELEKIRSGITLELLKSKTTPRTDAFVKILIAFRDIVIPLFRPIGSACMFAFGAYCLENNITISEPLQIMLFGAPVGWGYSRHKEKGEKIKRKKPDDDDWDQDD